MSSLHRDAMRTVDVAREVGYSVQQIRILERDAVLPPVSRAASGYRLYGARHVRAARAYRQLVHVVGPVEARRLIRDLQARPIEEALALLDAVHTRLDRERARLHLTREALARMGTESVDSDTDDDAMRISELAGALGVRTSTLRHWDAEGLVTPERVSRQQIRRYPPVAVREARIVQALRCAGYGIAAIREVLPSLRGGTRVDEVDAVIERRVANVGTRSRALLAASADLATLILPDQAPDKAPFPRSAPRSAR